MSRRRHLHIYRLFFEAPSPAFSETRPSGSDAQIFESLFLSFYGTWPCLAQSVGEGPGATWRVQGWPPGVFDFLRVFLAELCRPVRLSGCPVLRSGPHARCQKFYRPTRVAQAVARSS